MYACCWLGNLVCLWNLYVRTLFSQSSDFTKWTLTFQSLSFYLGFLFHCWQVAVAFCQFWNNVDMGEENRTVLTSSVAICAMFQRREKSLQSCEAQRKSIHGWFFHTSGPSPYHLSPNEAHSLSTSPLLRRWRRAQIAKIYQVCRWSIHVPQWNASVTNDELLTSDEWSCHHHSQIQLACM